MHDTVVGLIEVEELNAPAGRLIADQVDGSRLCAGPASRPGSVELV